MGQGCLVPCLSDADWLKFNTLAPQRPIRLVFEDGGKVLGLKTEFESDAKVFFDKQP